MRETRAPWMHSGIKTDRYVVFAYYTMALGVISAVIGAVELFI